MGLESPLPQPLHGNRWPLRVFLTLAVLFFLISLAAVISLPSEGAGFLAGTLVILTAIWMLFSRAVMRHAHAKPKLVPEQALLWDNHRDGVKDGEVIHAMESMTDEEFLKRAWRLSAVVWTVLVALMVPAIAGAAALFFTSGHATSHKVASIPPYAAGFVWTVLCIWFAVRANRYSRQLDHAERDAYEARAAALDSLGSSN